MQQIIKNTLILFTVIFLTSFTVNDVTKKLPNGHYLVELDKKFKDNGLVDFDFTLENEKFTMKIANKYETLEIKWIDENSFIVIGYTEPSNPTELEKKIMSQGNKIEFRITKQEDTIYYFTLGEKFEKYPIYSGKFIKTQ